MSDNSILFIGGINNAGNKNYYKQYYPNFYFSSDPLQEDIIKGLAENYKEKITVLNLPFFPKSKESFIVERGTVETNESHIINVGFVRKNFFEHFSKERELGKELLLTSNSIETIVVYSAYFPFLRAVRKYKKTANEIKVVLIVPDLVRYTGISNRRTIRELLSAIIRNILFEKCLSIVDGFVFLTEQMNNVINKRKKPFAVVEGIAPSKYNYSNLVDKTSIMGGKRIILYSGTLQYRYGIRALIDVAKEINFGNYEFHFYGTGEAKNELIELSRVFSQIKFWGSIDREELYKRQQMAYALINPRKPSEDFTKYSFPSKNLEYLLSGRPVICYKLPGIPKEYDGCFYYIQGNDNSSLYNSLVSFFKLSEKTVNELGARGRSFALTHKNYIVQTARIAKLIETIKDNK